MDRLLLQSDGALSVQSFFSVVAQTFQLAQSLCRQPETTKRILHIPYSDVRALALPGPGKRHVESPPGVHVPKRDTGRAVPQADLIFCHLHFQRLLCRSSPRSLTYQNLALLHCVLIRNELSTCVSQLVERLGQLAMFVHHLFDLQASSSLDNNVALLW